MIILHLKLEQIRTENKRLLSKIEQLKVTDQKNEDTHSIKSDIKTILSLIQTQQIQNKEILTLKNDIQDIKYKIHNSKEEMK